MLLDHEKQILQEILKWDNVNEAFGFLVKQYADMSVHHARAMLEIVPKIADSAIRAVAKESSDNAQAAYWLMCQRKMKPDNDGAFFASMLPVCKVMFPTGKYDGGSDAKSEYWELFLEQFQNPKVFSWEKDAVWAEHYGYTEYLKLVESQLKEEGK